MINHLTHLLGGILINIHNISIQLNRMAYAITVISINIPFENEIWISCLNQYGYLELWENFQGIQVEVELTVINEATAQCSSI